MTIITYVNERHTMKHTTKPAAAARRAPKRRMIGLRLDDATMAEIESLAAAEMRSLADMARICVRAGLTEIQTRIARSKRR